MATITLPDGRTLEMRIPVYLSETNAIIELAGRASETNWLQWFNELAAILRPAVVSTSWGGDIADMSEGWLAQVSREWQEATDEAVLPLPTGSGSKTRSRSRATRSLASMEQGSLTPPAGSPSAT